VVKNLDQKEEVMQKVGTEKKKKKHSLNQQQVHYEGEKKKM